LGYLDSANEVNDLRILPKNDLICRGYCSVTAETALLFTKAFRASRQRWMNLQAT